MPYDSFVFKSADIRIRFVSGARDPDKTEVEILFSGADLQIREKQETVFHRDRGALAHRRRTDEPFPAELFFSWRYCSHDIYAFINEQLQAEVSTSAPGENLCTEPYDYTTADWTKSNVTISTNGTAPGGAGTAQRLTPTLLAGFIKYDLTYNPNIGEWVYIDWWSKAETLHTAQATVDQTYHGTPPAPASFTMDFTVSPRGWRKHTTGWENQCPTKEAETLSLWFYPDKAATNYSMDLWEVYIRRDIPTVKTWDMYIDVYKDGEVYKSIVIEHVAYRNISFTEGEQASIYSALFDSKSTYPVEIEY